MRVLKIFLIICCILIILVGGTLAALFFLVDPNDYKDDIAAAVKKQTGRELAIPGDINLSVFPWLGLEMGQVTLGNAPGFSDKVFAGIDKAELRIKILPLLHKELRIGTIVLDGFQLNLEKGPKGTTNWSDLGKKDSAPADKPTPTEEQPEQTPATRDTGFALAALAIDGVQITNGRIALKDRINKTSIALTNVEMTADNIALGTPFSLFFGFDAHMTEPDLAARITLKGNPLVDPQTGTYAVSKAALNISGTGSTLPGGKVDLDLTTDVSADLHKELLTISNILLTAYGLNLKGKVNGQTILSNPTFNGELHLAPFNPKQLMGTMGLPPLQTADPDALTSMQADVNFTAGTREAALTDLTMKLDATTLQGTARVNHFDKPAITFQMDVDTINVDRYLVSASDRTGQPQAAKEDKPASTPTNDNAGSKQNVVPIPLPLDTLRSLDVNGKVTMGTVTVNKLNLSSLLVQMVAKQGLITLDPIAAALYEGTFGGTAVLDVRGKTPRMHVTQKITSVQMGPLLKDMTGKDTLTGTTMSTASLSTSGMDVNQLKSGLNGKVAFEFKDGAIKGINLPKMLRDAVTRIKGGTPDPSQVNQTDFASLGGTATITQGVVDNRDLLMMSPLMRVNGAGTVDLPKEGVDYLLKATIVASLKGQEGEPLSDLAGLTVPVRITGTLANPAFQLDIGSLLRDKGIQELKEKATEKLFKGKKPGGIDPGKILEGLFK
jgi:AsmA protein